MEPLQQEIINSSSLKPLSQSDEYAKDVMSQIAPHKTAGAASHQSKNDLVEDVASTAQVHFISSAAVIGHILEGRFKVGA